MSSLAHPAPENAERSDLSGSSTDTPPLVVRTVEISDPGALLDLLPPTLDPGELLCWVRRGEGLIGWGRAASFTAVGPDRFASIDHWWAATSARALVRDEVGVTGTGPVVFASLPFSAESAHRAHAIVPEVVIGRRGDRWWMTTASPEPHIMPDTAPLDLQPAPPPTPHGAVVFEDGALTPAAWESSVADAVRRITDGVLDKVVLARDLVAHTQAPVDPRWVLQRLAERYDSTWVFSVAGLIGATPEMLVRRDRGLVTSRVLAGTIRRTGDDDADLALAGSLARSSKDLEEHEYAVRSVADALAPHCSSMNVPEAPFVLHLANVMHLATDVAGVVTDDVSSLALASALHPSAAVCGTPTSTAAELIAELEQMDRGRYASPVGWMDSSGDGEWGIALRCGQLSKDDPTTVRLYAGCGIVAGSDPVAELAESDVKLVPMRDALASD